MILSPSKSDQESKLIFKDASEANINSSYRFIDPRNGKDYFTLFGFGYDEGVDLFEIENCGSGNRVQWDPSTALNSLQKYVFGSNDVTNPKWRLIREKSNKDAYQIVDAKDDKNNLYLSSTFLKSTNERLAMLWTGATESDWVGDEHLRRVFTFEKFERHDVR